LAEISTFDVKELLIGFQGQEITLDKIRSELQIERGTKSYDAVRTIVFRLAEQKVLRYLSRNTYKVVRPAKPVSVFGTDRERRPPYPLVFPRDFDTGMEMDFACAVVIREGDLVTVGGVKSKGKTTLCLSVCGENIDKSPVLMGNEYTILGDNGYEPAPRFLGRLDSMSEWVEWTNGEGVDKFTLLPVREDYVEHIIKNRLNIIDWINIDAGRLYDIGKVLEGIKASVGRGVAVVALQKSESSSDPRGGQFVRDFSDLELLLDGYGKSEDDIMLTVKGAKEKNAPIVGKQYAYTIIGGGTKIINFREVKKCPSCQGRKFTKSGECDNCYGIGFVDK